MTDNLFNRKGLVKIGEEDLRNNPEEVMKIMGKVIVLDVIKKSFENEIKYYCLSPYFEPIKQNQKVPEYTKEDLKD